MQEDKINEIDEALDALEMLKQSFTPTPPANPPQGAMPPGAGGMMPPQGAPPMDPSMMGGMPPQGAPPMDPSMMGGMPPQGAPPMDPAMMAAQGGMPPQGAPPMDPAMMAAQGGGAPPQGAPPMDPSMMGAAAAPPPISPEIEGSLTEIMGVVEQVANALEHSKAETSAAQQEARQSREEMIELRSRLDLLEKAIKDTQPMQGFPMGAGPEMMGQPADPMMQ